MEIEKANGLGRGKLTMSVVCVIPARFNSSRFPGKLLALAGGKTVLQRTFESALRCSAIEAVFVATDDERIGSHIKSLGGDVIWTSPACKNGTERLGEALKKDKRLQKASYLINLQGDHPCTQPATLTAVVQALSSDPAAAMSTAAAPLRDSADFLSPHVVKCVFDSSGNALYFSRSPIPYRGNAYVHIGLYCYRPLFLLQLLQEPSTPLQEGEDLEQLKVLEKGHRIKIAVVEEQALGVDTPQDLEKLKRYTEVNSKYVN